MTDGKSSPSQVQENELVDMLADMNKLLPLTAGHL